MRNKLAWVSRLALLAMLPACATPPLVSSGLLPAAPSQAQTLRGDDTVGVLSVTRVTTVPAAVEKAYAAALKATLADYTAGDDISDVTVSPLRPVMRLGLRGSAPVYVLAAIGNLAGKVEKDTVKSAFTIGFAFDETGHDTGYGASLFIDSVTTAHTPLKRRAINRATMPWDFEYMSKVPGNLNVALDLLHNRQMDDLSTMFAGKKLQPLQPTPGPGRIVAINLKNQIVGYIESQSAQMWDKNRNQPKGVEVVNVFDPSGALIEAEGRYLDPEKAENHKLFQFQKTP